MADHPFTNAPAHFLKKLPNPLPPDQECWRWQGHIRPSGYGELSYQGKTVLAHRLAYELAKGPIPPDHDIDHVVKAGCTSRACVNPSHLEAVTHDINMLRQGDAAPKPDAPRPGHLPERLEPHKFTPEKARQAGLASAAARAQRKALQNAQAQSRAAAVQIVSSAAPSDLSVRVRGACVTILDALLADDIPIRNGKEAADLLTCLHQIARLEEGQPTSSTLSVTKDLEEWKATLTQRLAG